MTHETGIGGTEPLVSRQYPSRPITGVGAVVFREDGDVLLVRRRYEPLAGHWTLPGGVLELGESLRAAVAREVFEETGLVVSVGDVIEAVEHVAADPDGRIRYHYVILDYLCRLQGGALCAGSDVDAAAFVDPLALEPFALTSAAQRVIQLAIARRRAEVDGSEAGGAQQ